MVDPLEVEQRFREVAAFSSAPTSPLRRLVLLDRFLQFLGDDGKEFESYLLDAAQLFQAVTRELPLSGHDPADLVPIAARLAAVAPWVKEAGGRAAIRQSLQRLQILRAAGHAFVGDIPGMLGVFGDRLPDGRIPSSGSPFERLKAVRADADRLDFQTTVCIEQVFREWESSRDPRLARPFIPVIEYPLGAPTRQDLIGALVTADFRVTASTDDSQDDIVANVQDLQPRNTTASLATAATQAARSFLFQTAPHAAQHLVAGRITFAPRHLLHDGASADLALAAMIYAGILAHTNQRVVYALQPAIALTGGTLPTGEVAPVDRSTLAVKVRSVFFSPAETLVVPRTQLDAARSAVEDLRARYPYRHLEVVGVDHLRDVFSDLRIIRRAERSRIAHSTRWLWQHRTVIGIAAIVTALLVTVAVLMSPPIDHQPASATYEGEMLVIRNRYNAVLDEIQVGAGTVSYVRGKVAGGTDGLLHSFVDVNGDGSTDLVYGVWPRGGALNTSHVLARRLHSGSVFWDVAVTDSLRFPESPDAADPSFSLSSVVVGALDVSGPPALFLSANNLFFPALLRRLDLRTGATLATYVHVGHILSMIYCADLDGDNRPELLCCGINNAFRRPFLAVFDPRFIEGHSPTQGAYVPEGLSPGLEKYYLLFPETVIGTAYRFKRKSASAIRIEIRSDQHSFFVHLDDVAGAVDDTGRLLSAGYYVYFDRYLRPLAVSTGETFDMLASQLVERGAIAAMPDKPYFEDYMKGIQYWDGYRWVNVPTVNRRYRDAVQRSAPQAGVPRTSTPTPP